MTCESPSRRAVLAGFSSAALAAAGLVLATELATRPAAAAVPTVGPVGGPNDDPLVQRAQAVVVVPRRRRRRVCWWRRGRRVCTWR
ncbi:hypothetical protein DA075_20970 [Methylobacterium currus]|uniref:Protamine-2 (Modular protein) n=2 Tax=Methylobacterium currus TaxID=2051553 RepID=A0A2R4WTZ6_9HYPH|nr:hypothetical protein DA075_20970 [Methylobacterium currus]